MKLSGPRKFVRTGDVEPEINVTPLVDVVLVLLIIFMVVAPRLNQDIPVDLPGIFNPDPDIKGAVDPLKVTVAKAGEYWIEDRSYNLDSVIEYLSAEHEADSHRRLVLRGDSSLKYGDVRDIFARCQQIGFPGMSLLVGERHKPKPVGAAATPGATAQGDAEPAAADGANREG